MDSDIVAHGKGVSNYYFVVQTKWYLQSQTVWLPRLLNCIFGCYSIPSPKGEGFTDPLTGTLKERAFDFPFVERRRSIISVPGAEALWLAHDYAHGCQESFMEGNEFAHVHPAYDGSMHLMLPIECTRELLAKGWGEPHPMAATGMIPATAVMVFAPRDEPEIETALKILATSYEFALGKLQTPHQSGCEKGPAQTIFRTASTRS